MDIGHGIVLAYIAGIAVAIVWWKRRARRAFNIDRVRVELHHAHAIEDRVIDAV